MRKSTCSVSFRKKVGIALENFADLVKTGVYENALVFKNPTITLLIFTALLADFVTARVAYEQGGSAQLPAYKKAMKALIEALNTLAPFVDSIALGDIPTIKMAGFEATFDPSQIGKPGASKVQGLTLVVEGGAVEELTSDCESFPAGTSFVGILSEGALLPAGVTVDALGAVNIPVNTATRIIVHTSKQRKKKFKNLKSGLYYYCYYFILNKLGASQISNAVKTMCQ